MHRILLCLALGALAGLAPGRLAGQQDPAQELRAVEFVGAASVPEDSLAAAIANRPTGCSIVLVCWFGLGRDRHYLQPDELQADALRLRLYYFQRGYRSTRVTPEVVPVEDGVRLRFTVEEGEPIRVASVALPGLPEPLRHLGGRLPLRPGQPFSLIAQEEARDSLRAMLRERGYAGAEVLTGYRIPRDSQTVAFVEYQVYPGSRARFGPVRVIGAQKVDTAAIRRMLSFREGDLFRTSELALSQRNLFGVDLFRHAQVAPDSTVFLADSVVPIAVTVNEGDTHRLRFGAGVNTEECVNAETRWAHRNFVGGARRLELRARVANVLAEEVANFPCNNTGSGIYDDLTGSLNADFVQPAFLTAGQTLGAGLFAERHSVPGVFVRSARGAYVSLTRSPGTRSSFTIGYRPELTELDVEREADFCTNFTACESQDIRVLSDRHWLAPIAASFARDRSNSLFAPTSGYVLRLDGEFASGATGSEFDYARLLGELNLYRGLGRGVVLAARVRPGLARAVGEPGQGGLGLHPQKRFYAGGPNSVRGFAQYQLGPKILSVEAERLVAEPDSGGAGCTVASVNDGSCDAGALADGAFDVRPVGGSVLLEANAELRFPIFGLLRGAAFVDVGQVWRTVDEARLGDLAFTPGVGIRYFSPAGPIRIDVGYNGQGSEMLQVLTTGLEEADGDPRPTDELRALDAPVAWNRPASFFERLQLHFSIGQAF